MKVRSGATRLFISFKARNPGRAFFKYQLRISSGNRDGGRIYIPFPEDVADTIAETDMYAALMGEGYGQRNLFNLGMHDGTLSGAPRSVPVCPLLMLLVSAIMAFMCTK